MSPGTILYIYSSQDGTTWENLNTSCTIDDERMCTFQTPHLTIFTFVLFGTEYNFFIGDEECNELTETTNSELTVYICITPPPSLKRDNGIKLSNISNADAGEQSPVEIALPYEWNLSESAEGLTTVYAQLRDSGTNPYVAVTDTINVVVVST
ncbi:hypothetical protein KKG31_00950 [Patescibacteria group bacterium]|nr:hypothetical protein [Patescibacteria group bacterium]MBU1757748.1 hypothetical protein [Patescibacteria group bacterium]